MIVVEKFKEKCKQKEVERHFLKVLCVFIVVLNAILLSFISNKQGAKKIDFSDDWLIKYNDQKEVKMKLQDFTCDRVKNGDTIVLRKVIDKKTLKKIETIQYALLVKQRNIEVNVFIDNEATQQLKNKDFYVISIPSSAYGKEIKLEYKIREREKFSKLSNILLCDEYDYVKDTMREEVFCIIASGFMLIFGIMTIIFILCTNENNSFLTRISLTGTFMICICFWFFSMSRTNSIFFENKILKDILEYYSIYYGVPVLTIFSYTFVEDKKIKKQYQIITKILTVIVVGATVWTLLDSSMIIFWLSIIELLGMGIIIWSAKNVSKVYKNKSKSEKILIWSYVDLGVSMVIESAIFIVKTQCSLIYQITYIMKISLIVFMVLMLWSCFTYASEFINNNVEKETLTEKAYQDILTGLYNRSKVNETLDSMIEEKKKEYTIIYFDLNDLKKINDSLGHIAGDRYLVIFSECLKENMVGEFSVIGRMGGDEFIAIAERYFKKDSIEKRIQKILNDVIRRYQLEYKKDVSFAYGYISSNEKRYTELSKALKIADDKMYICKKRQKET